MRAACILMLLAPFICTAAVNPDRTVDWEPGVTVGVEGGIEQHISARTNIIDVTLTPYFADKTGVTNASTAVASAVSAAASNAVVFLPAGRYLFNTSVELGAKDYITLRGAGSDQTVIDYRGSSGAAVSVSASAGNDYLWDWPTNCLVLDSPPKGATNLTLTNINLGDIAVGRICEVRIANSTNAALPVLHVSGYTHQRKQQIVVKSKTSTNITVWPPLAFALPAESSPRFVMQSGTATRIGIEGITIEMTNSTSTAGVGLAQASDCWIYDVLIRNTANYHCSVSGCVGLEMRRCYFDRRKVEGGPNGAGLLFARSSGSLFEDNIIVNTFPSIEVNFGACYNVFAYNYLYESSSFGQYGVSIDSNHAPHNSFNLYEGNIAPNIQADGYFGSVSEDTVFRNWLTGEADDGGARGLTVNLNRFTRAYSVVGNILGRGDSGSFIYPSAATSSDWGMPNMGNFDWVGTAEPSTGDWWADWQTSPGSNGFQELDLDVFNTLLLAGNWNTEDEAIPAGEALDPEDVLPDSLFRSSRPDFFGSLAWPTFDPSTATVGSYSNLAPARIPAHQAFLNGGTWQTQRRATAGTVNVGTLTITP
jgi:hypothetical protein